MPTFTFPTTVIQNPPSQVPPTDAVMPLVFEGDGMWQMRLDLSTKTKAASRALKQYNSIMISPVAVSPGGRLKVQTAVIDTQKALTEARTFWILAGLAERDMWHGHPFAPTFWQVLQEGQKLIANGLDDQAQKDYMWTNAQVNALEYSEHNKAPGLCNAKQPLGGGLPPGKFLLTHECKDKEYVKAAQFELKSEAVHLDLNDEVQVKAVTTALVARYKKFIAKMVDLQKKRLALKEGLIGAAADKIIDTIPKINSFKQVVAVLEAVNAGVNERNITKTWDKQDKPTDVYKQMHMGAKPVTLQTLESSRIYLVNDRGFEYIDVPEGGAYRFTLKSSCLTRRPPPVPLTENDRTIEFFNTSLSPKLTRFIKITIETSDHNSYEMTIQPFHGMNTSVICPFFAKSKTAQNLDMSDFASRDYNVYQLEPYAIQGKADFEQAMGHVLLTAQNPAVKNLMNNIPEKTLNDLIMGGKFFPDSRVYYSASNAESGGASVYFVCFAGQILGVEMLSPGITGHLWTDNVNPVKPPPLVAFRGRPRREGSGKGRKANQWLKSERTAMIYTKELTDEDENKKNSVPKVVEVKGIPDKEKKISVRFNLVDIGSLVYESEGLATKLELRPAKRDFGNNVTISWNINLKAVDGKVQMIGYKIQSPIKIKESPSYALIQKEKNMWKFELDIHGDKNYHEIVSEVEISEQRGGGKTTGKTEIGVENVKPASTWSMPKVAKASLYAADYPNKLEIIDGKIPQTIVVDGLPEPAGYFGRFIFDILDSNTLTYSCRLHEANEFFESRFAVILRPAIIGAGKIEWEFIQVNDYNTLSVDHLMDDDDVVIGKKKSLWEHDPSNLFQKTRNLWEFTKHVQGGQLTKGETHVMELIFKIDPTREKYIKGPHEISLREVLPTPISNRQPFNKAIQPPAGSGNAVDVFQSSGASSSNPVSVVVPKAMQSHGLRRGGLYTDEFQDSHRLPRNEIPHMIIVHGIPIRDDIIRNVQFNLENSATLFYKSADTPDLRLNLRVPVQGESVDELIGWELYVVTTGKLRKLIAKKAVIESNIDANPISWLFQHEGECIWDFKMNAFEQSLDVGKQYKLHFEIPKQTFVKGNPEINDSVLLDVNTRYIRDEFPLPLQPRRLSSRPAPAPWASPAVDMESLMASIDDIKRALNEVHLSARARA